MEKIKILIVEDEWIVSEEIKEILLQNDYEVIGQADSSDLAMSIINEIFPDVVLMDINIKGKLNGIELASKILAIGNPAIIFLTAYSDDQFIERSKKVRPAAYLVKPFEEKNIKASIEIAYNNLSTNKTVDSDSIYQVNDYIFLKQGDKFSKVSILDILFVKAEGSYIDIYLKDRKITLAVNLKNFHTRLNDPRFMRVHRSYLVNIEQISSISGNSIYVYDEVIPISHEHKDELLSRLKLI